MKKIFYTSTHGENVITNNGLQNVSSPFAVKYQNQKGLLRKLILAIFVFLLFIFNTGALPPAYTLQLTPASLNFPGLSGGTQIVTIHTTIPLGCLIFSYTGCVTHVSRSDTLLTVICSNNGLSTALTGSVTVWDDCGYNRTATVTVSQDAGTIIPRAVSGNKNYIRLRTILKDYIFLESSVDALSSDEMQETITYFDGLGRMRQNVSWQASPAKYDIVVPVAFDVFGREDKKYLPYALSSNNNGAFVSADVAGQSAYYSSVYGADGANAFAQTNFEASPLNRVLRQGAPGSTWQPNVTPASDHSVKFDEGTNIASEVKLWKVVNDVLTDDGFYAASTLFKTTTWDENNDQTSGTASHTEEFKDLQGKIVLKVATDAGTKHYTYYVYDDLELLRFVLTPKAMEDNVISGTELDDLCYQYKYDPRKRMTDKKLPGVGWTYLAYDLRDRPVATQDPVMRDLGRWLVTKYDKLNRPVMTASKALPDDLNTLQTYLNNYLYTSSYYESRDASGIGYTTGNSFNTKLSITESDLLTVTYYDTYDYTGVKSFDPSVRLGDYFNSTTGNYYFDRTKGQVTGEKVKVLDGTENNASGFRWLLTTNYYDDRYRVIQTLRDLYATDATYYESVSTLYDFVGKVIQTKQAQTFNSVTTTVDKYLTYDQAGRLTKTEQQIAGDANGKVTVAQNIYNETGQLIDKKLHKAGSYDYLQSVDYTYNIRGWLTSINNPDNLSALQSGDPNIDLFGEKLLYEATESGLNSSYIPQFNGNISAMVWNSTQKSKQGYGFTYDGLNRLTLGDHKDYTSAWTDNNNYEEKSLAYDKNGNINRLVRTNSTSSNLADFTYTYSGNKLSNINGGTAYSYDLNGNTTLDGLRGVSIGYNILNLPKLVSKGADNITYIYSAVGEKLAKKMNTNYKYYAGNMVYNNDKTLNYLLFDEGLVNKISGGYAYEYQLKDHLGNTRVTFQPNGSTTTTTQVAEYYPFGSSYMPISPAGSSKYLYNGKEKQDDVLGGTALDWYDYGARFYDPMVGRWNSVDIVSESYFRHSPYSYSFNNPIKYYDPNGIWPEAIHNSMLGIFRGLMSTNDLATLMQASKEADTWKYQKPELSFRHAMGGSAVDYNDFINEQFGLALKASDRSKGLEQLGFALHAIMDNSSPTHKGFQVWKGLLKEEYFGGTHWNGEQWHAYLDPVNSVDIILAMQEMKELYGLFDMCYGKSNLIGEVNVVAKNPEGLKSLDTRIENMSWQYVRTNANGNTGRYNKPGSNTDQNYSDDFLKWYYGK